MSGDGPSADVSSGAESAAVFLQCIVHVCTLPLTSVGPNHGHRVVRRESTSFPSPPYNQLTTAASAVRYLHNLWLAPKCLQLLCILNVQRSRIKALDDARRIHSDILLKPQ